MATDIIHLFIRAGHVLFEMCTGYELYAPKPTARHLEDMRSYPQVNSLSKLVNCKFYLIKSDYINLLINPVIGNPLQESNKNPNRH